MLKVTTATTLLTVPSITETESESELATYTLFVVGLTDIARGTVDDMGLLS
jgi:hypothetical protein